MAGIAIGVLFVLLVLFGLLSLYLYRRRRARAVPPLSPALPLQDPDPERASSFFAGRSSYFFSGFGSTSGRSNTNTSTNSTYGSVGSAAREKYLARGPSNASTASTFSRQQSQRSRYGPNLSGLPEEDELAGAADGISEKDAQGARFVDVPRPAPAALAPGSRSSAHSMQASVYDGSDSSSSYSRSSYGYAVTNSRPVVSVPFRLVSTRLSSDAWLQSVTRHPRPPDLELGR